MTGSDPLLRHRWRRSLAGMQASHVQFAAGQLLLVAATFAFGLVAARLLGPADMGTWQTANLVATYGMFITMGVTNGMAREIPYHIGSSDFGLVNQSVAAALWALVGSSVVVSAAAYASLRSGLGSEAALWLGLALLGVRILNGGSAMLLRSHQAFSRLAVHQAGTAIILLVCIPWLAHWPTLPTLLGCVAVALISVCAVSHPYWKFRHFRTRTYVTLVRIGLPIMLGGMLFSLLTTVDRLLILTLLDTTALGLYTPAISMFGALLILPSLVSNVMYPRLAEKFGRTRSVSALLPTARRIVALNFAVTLPVAVALAATFYFILIPQLLPAYVPGKMPTVVVAVSALFLPLASFGDLFNVIGWQRYYLRNMAVGFFVNGVAGYLLVEHADMGLIGVAWGTVFGVGAYSGLQLLTFLGATGSCDVRPDTIEVNTAMPQIHTSRSTSPRR